MIERFEYKRDKDQWIQDLCDMLHSALREREHIERLTSDHPPYDDELVNRVVKLTEGMTVSGDEITRIVVRLATSYKQMYERAKNANDVLLGVLLQLPHEILGR